ncbi:MAG: hypothetical protein ACYC5O_24135 [Anaerolineae bacterium]
MYLTILLDAEDIVDPRSDDVSLEIARMFREEDAPATFGVTGEKARLWEKRGRRDIIDAVAALDVNYHSNFSSVHPTVAEYLEDKGWDDGIAEVLRQEQWGVEDQTRIFGHAPTCWVTPGRTWGPQVTPAVRLMGLQGEVYGDTHLENPVYGAHYFCGTLCYANNYYGAFDAAFSDDRAFQQRWEAAHETIVSSLRRGANWLSVYMCNPTTVRASVHWDKLNFDHGVNTPPDRYRLAEWTTDAQWEVAKRNMRRLVRESARIPDISGKTHAELTALAVPPPDEVPAEELRVRARLALRQSDISTDDPLLSPAELLYSWALWLDSGRPEALPWRYVEGPIEEAVPGPNVLVLSAASALGIAAAIRRGVEATGRLPVSVAAGTGQVGIGMAYRALATLVAGEALAELQIPLSRQVPAIGDVLAGEVKHLVPGWLHKPDLDVSRLAAYTRLQSWTLKPALFR